ncbi:MAG: sensor histidine kinase [Candidatus Heimdallarchaeota archaeon]|nr:sensor histidine kinase [Candidatus Heimdallarchaeota archaeon]
MIDQTGKIKTIEKQNGGKSPRIRDEPEFYYTIQSHFIRNDLQKLMLILEVIKSENHSILDETVAKAIKLCLRASKKINTLSLIHNVQHSTFEKQNEKFSLLGLFEDLVPKFELYITLDTDSLNHEISVDNLFCILISEILIFIENAGGNFIRISARPCDSNLNYFIITISESQNEPFSKKICDKLMSNLADEEWDYLGQNIEITLANMIAEYYGGKLGIYPSKEKGNSYCIILPSCLISESK